MHRMNYSCYVRYEITILKRRHQKASLLVCNMSPHLHAHYPTEAKGSVFGNDGVVNLGSKIFLQQVEH
jgi:hypothetical protein